MPSPPGGRRRPPLALLASAAALSPFGMTSIIPTLVALGGIYAVTPAWAQFVISAYLFGLGVTQPFSGLLCDRLGRRPVMMGGIALFLVASVGCALAGSFWTLVAWRFVQAVGISVGTVASRAIIRDTCDPIESLRALGVLAAGLGAAPVVAPAFGGLIGEAFGPPGVFLATGALAAIILAWVTAVLPETRPPGTTGDGEPLLPGYRELLRSPVFVGNTLLFGFIQGSFFAFLGVGAMLFETRLGIGQQGFGIIWGVLSIAYVGSAAGAGRLAGAIGPWRTMVAGTAIAMAAGWGMLILGLVAGTTLWTVILPIGLLMIGSGFVTPMSMAGAVAGRPELAGRAAGLSSAIGLVLSGVFAVATGLFYSGSLLPVAALIAAAATAAAAMLGLIRAGR